MKVRTEVGENLFIAADTLGSTARQTDDNFKTVYVASTDSLIEPVSTVDGKAFFYTVGTNVRGDGDAHTDSYKSYNVSDFNDDYDTTGAVGYVDYVFQLKAVNGAADSEIVLTKLDLTYGGASPANNNKAYRVAMFVEDLGNKTTAGVENFTAPTGDLGGLTAKIFTPAGAKNFDDASPATTNKAVASTTALGAVSYVADTTSGKMDVGTNRTQYYKVVIRLWLEGEDNTCNNLTFMDLKDGWALDLGFDLVADSTSTPAMQNIGLLYTASKIDLSAGPSSAATTTITVDGQSYYPITGNTNYYLTTASTAVASDSVIYKMDANGKPVDVTNQCTLPAPVPAGP